MNIFIYIYYIIYVFYKYLLIYNKHVHGYIQYACAFIYLIHMTDVCFLGLIPWSRLLFRGHRCGATALKRKK